MLRGVQVMLDRDLAHLYWVTTSALNQAVKRNRSRFPERFMFQMTAGEFENWKSQNVMSNSDDVALRMGLRRSHRTSGFGIGASSGGNGTWPRVPACDGACPQRNFSFCENCGVFW